MRIFLSVFFIGAVILCLAGISFAGSTGSQSFNIEIGLVSDISVSGAPNTMIIETAPAGMQPEEIIEKSTTYSVMTNGMNKKITGTINVDMPSNTTIKINLAAPAGAKSKGDVVLSSNPAVLVTDISNIDEGDLVITYKFSANVAAGVVPMTTRTLILTIAD